MLHPDRKIVVVDPFPVRCIDVSELSHPLTKGKGYMVVATMSDYLYQVYDDNGRVNFFNKLRFVKIPLCKKCGGVIELSFHEHMNRKLMKLQMCHSCEFWALFQHDMRKEPHRHFIVDGNGYSYHPKGTHNIDGKRGFGGAEFYIRFADGCLMETDNLSHRGDIPVAWKEDLPDNAAFMNYEDYMADLQAQQHGAD